MDIVVIISAMAVVIATLISVVVVKGVRKKALLSQSVSNFPRQGLGEIDGQPYRWHQSGAGQNKNPSFDLSVPCPHDARFTIRRENFIDRFCKRIGLVEEIASFDEVFDTAHFISSPHSQFCSQLLYRSAAKSAVVNIIARGFTQLRLGRKGLSAIWTPYRPKERAITAEELPKLAAELISLTRQIAAVPLTEEDRLHQVTWRHKLTGLYLFFGLCATVGITSLIAGFTGYSPLDPGAIFLITLKWSLPALFIFMYITFQLLKGNASAHGHFLSLSFLTLAACLMLAFGGCAFLNGYLDQSPAKSHSVQVLDKYYTKSKNNYTYHLKLESWRPGRSHEDQTVSRSIYDQITPNESRLELVTRTGHWQFEWLVSYRIENP